MNNESKTSCPRCGNDNKCGIVGGIRGICWCFKEAFPSEFIEMVPLEQRGKVCICKGCLDTFKKSKTLK